MSEFTIKISWPAKSLNPNSRAHWAVAAKAKKLQKEEAWAESKRAWDGARIERPEISIKAFPRVERGRDQDNLVASLKGAMDGIALGLGVDDKHFRIKCIEFAKADKSRDFPTVEIRVSGE